MVMFPVSNFVFFLSAHNVPPTEIDRITIVMLSECKPSTKVAMIGDKHIKVVRDFLKIQRRKLNYRKRIHELATHTCTSMEGEDSSVKRARVEFIVSAVHTLGSMSSSSR